MLLLLCYYYMKKKVYSFVTSNKQMPTEYFLSPETSSILANMGGNGNSAILIPKGEVRWQLSSKAKI